MPNKPNEYKYGGYDTHGHFRGGKGASEKPGKSGKYGGLGMGAGHNVDPEKAHERAQKAAAARWADPKQHEIQAEALRGRPGHSGHHGISPEQREKMQQGYRAHLERRPSKGPGSGTPRGSYKRRQPVPVREEHALRREAQEKFPDDEERQDAFVYGIMRKQGWKPEHHSPWDGKTYKHWYWGVMKV